MTGVGGLSGFAQTKPDAVLVRIAAHDELEVQRPRGNCHTGLFLRLADRALLYRFTRLKMAGDQRVLTVSESCVSSLDEKAFALLVQEQHIHVDNALQPGHFFRHLG
jgi:hypothetical protein